MSDDDRDGRRKRLRIILAIAAVTAIAAATTWIVASRRVDSDVAAVLERADSATIDPSTIAFESYGADGSFVADALGVDPTALELQQDLGNQWCITVKISHLASSQSLHFHLNDKGLFQRSTPAEIACTDRKTLEPTPVRRHTDH